MLSQKGSVLVIGLLIAIFVLLVLAGGYYWMMQKQPVPVSSSQIADWKDFSSPDWKISLKYPSTWTIKDSDDKNNVNITSDVKTSFGTNAPLIDGLQFYIWITQISNPKNLSFKDLVTDGLDSSIKNTFTFQQEQINGYTVYKTDMLPSESGALHVYITRDNNKYILIGLAPYDSQKPPNNQDKVLPLFNQIISTFKFTD